MTPRYCSTGRKTSKVLDCYAGFNDKLLGESYWVELEHSTVDLQQEINQVEKHDSKQKSETQHEDVKTSKDKSYDLRYRPNIHPPDRYTDPGQYPILIKGTQGHYVPWQTLGLAGLIARLPEGASKWIRAFEEETVGKLLAVGDIKAVWARCFGAPSMEDILRHSNGC